MVTIVVLFTICWGPALIDNVLVAFGVVNRLNYGHLKPMRQAFDVMSYFNSCVNPIVYAFMSKNWRKSFFTALCSCCSKPASMTSLDRTHYWNRTTQSAVTTGATTGMYSTAYNACQPTQHIQMSCTIDNKYVTQQLNTASVAASNSSAEV